MQTIFWLQKIDLFNMNLQKVIFEQTLSVFTLCTRICSFRAADAFFSLTLEALEDYSSSSNYKHLWQRQIKMSLVIHKFWLSLLNEDSLSRKRKQFSEKKNWWFCLLFWFLMCKPNGFNEFQTVETLVMVWRAIIIHNVNYTSFLKRISKISCLS